MKTIFSKPSQDLASENLHQLEQDRKTLKRQRKLSTLLLNAEPRTKCLLCDEHLSEEGKFDHRGIPFARCENCGHVQSTVLLPDGYPHQMDSDVAFDVIYPKLERKAYISRRQRIYQPKLEWALESLGELGILREQALSKNWLELGAGAGYFLDALKAAGSHAFSGIERDEALCAIANETVGKDRVKVHQGSLGDSLRNRSPDIIASFFVLEHLQDGDDFWSVLAEMPKGTIFIFAVPVFGFATMLEGAFENFAARNLDGVVHTQLYTDASISYALDRAGYEVKAEWVFGQDATDLMRAILVNAKEKFDEAMHTEMAKQLSALIDPMQSVIDKAHLSDARHILAVKS